MIIALPSLGPGSPSPMSFSNPVDLEMAESDSPCTEGASGRSEIKKKNKKYGNHRGRERTRRTHDAPGKASDVSSQREAGRTKTSK